MDKIRIACGNRGVGTSPLFAAVEGGYMGENGLDPELKFYEGHPRALPALVAGEAEFTNTVSPDVITIDMRDRGDVVIVAIPDKNITQLPSDLFAGVPDSVVVVDTGNYYPQQRDGRIDGIEAGAADSRWVALQLHRPG